MAKINKVKTTNDLELQDRLVAINRVTKVTKGGRAFSFAAIVVVGNGDGVIGWGLGKANEVTAAIAKGVEAAKKNPSQSHQGACPQRNHSPRGSGQIRRLENLPQARFRGYRSEGRRRYARRA